MKNQPKRWTREKHWKNCKRLDGMVLVRRVCVYLPSFFSFVLFRFFTILLMVYSFIALKEDGERTCWFWLAYGLCEWKLPVQWMHSAPMI